MNRGLDRQSQVLERETEIKTGDGGDGDGRSRDGRDVGR